MLGLVLDTNVLVSAIFWRGLPSRLPPLALVGSVRLFTSPELIAELRTTLSKAKLRRVVAASSFTPEELVNRLLQVMSVVHAPGLAVPVSRDPDDDNVLACAVAAQVDLIVSGDADLLVLGNYADIPIVTVVEAMRRITEAADRAERRSAH